MSDLLIASLEDVIQGICVDERKTKAHEDMIRFTHKDGLTQVDIACLSPPQWYVPEGTILDALYNELGAQDDSDLSQFLTKESKIQFSLDEKEPRRVLVASYVLNEQGKLILEELSTTSAIATMCNYEDYSTKAECLEQIEYLLNILREKPELSRMIEHWEKKSFKKNNSNADYLIAMSINLFNYTCRDASIRKKVTFIERPRPSIGKFYFTKWGDFAVFNRPLRDPTAFLNAANLASYLENRRPVYTLRFLRENLPEGALKLIS
jgi:hypothetical protein